MFHIVFYYITNYKPCNIPPAILNNRLAISISGLISNITVVPWPKLFFIGHAFLYLIAWYFAKAFHAIVSLYQSAKNTNTTYSNEIFFKTYVFLNKYLLCNKIVMPRANTTTLGPITVPISNILFKNIYNGN